METRAVQRQRTNSGGAITTQSDTLNRQNGPNHSNQTNQPNQSTRPTLITRKKERKKKTIEERKSASFDRVDDQRSHRLWSRWSCILWPGSTGIPLRRSEDGGTREQRHILRNNLCLVSSHEHGVLCKNSEERKCYNNTRKCILNESRWKVNIHFSRKCQLWESVRITPRKCQIDSIEDANVERLATKPTFKEIVPSRRKTK